MLKRAALLGPLLVLSSCGHRQLPSSDQLGQGSRDGMSSSGGAAVAAGGASAMAGTTASNGAMSDGIGAGSAMTAPPVGGSTSAGGGANSVGGASGAAGAVMAGAAGAPLVGDPPGIPAAPFEFPQNFHSPHCIYPAAPRAALAQAAYTRWKTELVTAEGANGFRRVRRPNNEMDTTVSEGIGYGMILAVVMDDPSLFDDLWKYSQQFLNQNGLMNWEVGPDGKVAGGGAATDADEDMAWALALAHEKWGGQGSLDASYESLAKQQIDRIWNHEVDHGRGELLVAGDSWGNRVVYNPSYFAPNEYRSFGKVSGNVDGWNAVIDKGYAMLSQSLTDANGNANSGLVPAWTNDKGEPSAAFDGAPTNYQYDSARTPFRIGLDYCESGDQRAKDYLAKTSQFFSMVGASNIVDGYELNGAPQAENSMPAGIQSALFVGAAGVGAMSDPRFQGFVNDTYELLATKEMLPPSYYFNLSWQVFALLMMSGNLFDYTAR
jgi:endo-1,4-beta-D-glucanase Y